MGKVICDGAASDTSDNERKKSIRKEQKVRTKKKKRRKELTDLHQRLFKSKKLNRKPCTFWQNNFIKLLQRFADLREEYDKETKIDGKLKMARNSKRICTRILPRPLAGIYRNGATGKEVRRSQVSQPLDDINNARLQGNVLKLLDGYDSESNSRSILQPTPPGGRCISPILDRVDGKRKRLKDEYTENFHLTKCIELPQKSLEKKKMINSDNLRNSALGRYEELSRIICTENFEEQNFLDHFTTDPLTTVKGKLRNIYAESFRSQFLRDMIKRGTVLNECDTPSTSTENLFHSEAKYCFSGYTPAVDLVSLTVDRADSKLNYKNYKENNDLRKSFNFDLNGKQNKIASSKLLFDVSLLNTSDGGTKNFIEPEVIQEMKNVTTANDLKNLTNQTFVEINQSATSKDTIDNNIVKYFENDKLRRIKEKNKSVPLVLTEADLQNNFTYKKHLIARKNQRTQTVHFLNSALKRYPVKQSLKIPQPVKVKNVKNVPAILRKCNNNVTNNNNRLNLFEKSMYINKEPQEMLFDVTSKQNVLFTSQPLTVESNENSKGVQTSNTIDTVFDAKNTKESDVSTCLMGSSSLRNDEICFMKNSCPQLIEPKQQPQNQHVNTIFTNKKNPSIQKTVMFTKKDSQNIGRCLYLNSLINDETVDNSNVCIIKKNIPVQHEKSKNIYTVHKNCHNTVGNCCRAFHCSQNSDSSSHSSQEFKEASIPHTQHVQAHQKPIICEKVLLKRVRQHPKCENNKKCHNDQQVCYVVVDESKDLNNMQEYSNNNVPQIEKYRTLQGGRFCQKNIADVGILNGVQNLKILPVEEQEPQIEFTNNECIEDAVILEEQPVKYLAFENDSKPQKIPIYMQRNKHVAADNIKIINPSTNYHVVSCPQESTQKIIFVPTCEQNKVLYAEQQNLPHTNVSFKECSHPRKVIFYQPEVQCIKNSSNVCEIHVPKQNMVKIRKATCDTVVSNLQQAEIKRTKQGIVNWKKCHYQPNHSNI